MLKRRRKKHIPYTSKLPIVPIEEAAPIPDTLTPEQEEANSHLQKVDANDIMHEGGAIGLRNWFNELYAKGHVKCIHRNESRIVSLTKLQKWYPNLRKPVIHGLLRRGETLNIIGASKMGKSGLTQNLTMSIISGGMFLDKFQCEAGRVLICDNELHCETLVDRNKHVAKAFNVTDAAAGKMIDYLPLRGALIDLNKLEKEFQEIRPGTYSVIVLDAFYKMFPQGVDENDNADMANLYNLIDSYADCLESSFVLIHHTSKGIQSERAVTDVGSGAGAMSRAADTHLVLRAHEEPGIVVVDAAVRSWKPIDAFCARWKYPKWELAEGYSAEDLKGRMTKGQQNAKTKAEQAASDNATLEQKLLPSITKPMLTVEITALGADLGLSKWSKHHCEQAIKKWIGDGRLVVVTARSGSAGSRYQLKDSVQLTTNSDKSPNKQDDTDESADNDQEFPI